MVVSVVSKREFAGYWEYLLDEAVFTSPPHPRWSGAALMSRQGVLVAVGSLYVQDSLPESRRGPATCSCPSSCCTRSSRSWPPRAMPRVRRVPWLGMFGAEVEDRVVIAGLTDDGPADDAGLKVGDLVLGVAGEPVGGLSDFYRAVWALGPAGVEVPLDVYRDGELVHVAVHSADRRSFPEKLPTDTDRVSGMNESERIYLLERLERLGAEDDAELQAARELAARVSDGGLDWDDLIAPEDPPEDDFASDDVDLEEGGEDEAEEGPPLEGDGSAEMQLLQKLLERKGNSRALKEELQEIRRDAASEGLSDLDRRYLQALAKRLSVR